MAAERELSSSNRLALTPTHQIYLNCKKLIIHGGKVMSPCLREREGGSICIPRANAAHYKMDWSQKRNEANARSRSKER